MLGHLPELILRVQFDWGKPGLRRSTLGIYVDIGIRNRKREFRKDLLGEAAGNVPFLTGGRRVVLNDRQRQLVDGKRVVGKRGWWKETVSFQPVGLKTNTGPAE